MTDEQMTALARELAERLYNDDKSYRAILWWCNEPKEEKARELEYTLRFLLEDYCIVEKSKLEELNIPFRATQHLMIVMDSREIKDLFPELFKEEEK